jgi:BASS family bile acid:Na+ symporter
MTLQQTILLTMQVSVIITVFGFGLDAKVDDLLYVVRRPVRLLRALAAMFLVMPLLALGLDKLFEFRLEVEIALVALALSPVPPLLPRKHDKATGDGSSGVGLMATMALLSIVVIPLGVALTGPVFHRSFEMPPSTIARLIFMVAILPLAAGMAVGALLPGRVQQIFKPIRLVANILIVATALLIVWASRKAVVAQIGDGTFYALAAFIVVGLVVGHLLGGPAPRDRAVLALSTASRHPGIALAMASANFPNVHEVTATVLLYLLLNVVLSVPYVMWQKRRLGAVAAGP